MPDYPLPPTPPDPTKAQPSEPLIGPAAFASCATVAVGLAVAFGAKLTPAQSTAIVTAAGTLGPIVVWLWGRRRTWSPASVAALVHHADALRGEQDGEQ